MAKAVQKRRKGNTVTIDFAGVKSGGTIPEGRYKAKIIAVEQKEGQESGEPYSELTWEITSEKCNGREVRFDNYSHQPQALWRLKALLEALGTEVPDGEHEIDWDEIISDETECVIETTHEKRDSGTYSRVTGWDTEDSGNTVDDEDEDPKAGKETRRGTRSSTKDEDKSSKNRGRKDEEEEDDPPTQRRAKPRQKDEDEEDEAAVKKKDRVKFKDEKGKWRKGVVQSVDGDTAVVETDDGDDSYEMDIGDLTVID